MRDASVGHQCPECVAEGRRTVRRARTAFGGTQAGRQGYVTNALIGLNALMLLISVISAGGAGLAGGGFAGLFSSTTTPVDFWGGLIGAPTTYTDGPGGPVVASVGGVASGEYYRLVTAMFLHSGVFHLLVNMWALFVLGRNLEYALGPIRFLALYLLSGLGGSVAVYWFSDPHRPTVGASGAIFGLLAAFFIVLRRLGRDTSALLPVILLNVVITFGIPGISIAGHVGGFISGAILGAGLAYAPQKNRSAIQAGICVAFGVAMVLLALLRTATLTA